MFNVEKNIHTSIFNIAMSLQRSFNILCCMEYYSTFSLQKIIEKPNIIFYSIILFVIIYLKIKNKNSKDFRF